MHTAAYIFLADQASGLTDVGIARAYGRGQHTLVTNEAETQCRMLSCECGAVRRTETFKLPNRTRSARMKVCVAFEETPNRGSGVQ
jgi:hypothetical protein